MTPSDLRERVRAWAADAGFSISSDPEPYVSMFGHQGAHQVSGRINAERGIMLDITESRRRYRPRWVALAAAIPLLAFGWYELFTSSPLSAGRDLGLLSASVGLVMLVLVLLTIGNVAFSSEVLCVTYQGAPRAGSSNVGVANTPSTYTLTVLLGRGLSRNWNSKTQSGRTVYSVEDTDGGPRLRWAIIEQLSRGTPAQLPRTDPLPSSDSTD